MSRTSEEHARTRIWDGQDLVVRAPPKGHAVADLIADLIIEDGGRHEPIVFQLTEANCRDLGRGLLKAIGEDPIRLHRTLAAIQTLLAELGEPPRSPGGAA